MKNPTTIKSAALQGEGVLCRFSLVIKPCIRSSFKLHTKEWCARILESSMEIISRFYVQLIGAIGSKINQGWRAKLGSAQTLYKGLFLYRKIIIHSHKNPREIASSCRSPLPSFAEFSLLAKALVIFTLASQPWRRRNLEATHLLLILKLLEDRQSVNYASIFVQFSLQF